MNYSQKIVLGVGALVIALIVLFPPWVHVYHYEPDPNLRNSGAEERIERPAGYLPIWESHVATDQSYLISLFGIDPPRSNLKYFSMRIDKDRLGIQLVGVVLVTMLLAVLLKSAKDKTSHSQT
jgi:hypothetical protein